jgi:hypothetical protein
MPIARKESGFALPLNAWGAAPSSKERKLSPRGTLLANLHAILTGITRIIFERERRYYWIIVATYSCFFLISVDL